ncbi:DUF1173 family protein (plasmid) [Paraburkholderia sp. PREW-6R]|uniref:DUF1173 family protein n=1 Tax=Paraburkholderia sp. PREW-6R TaxID=3141544 RepID=UPI0031F48C34
MRGQLTPDGLNARLDVALTVRTVGPVKSPGPANVSHGSTSRRSAPLLGFLQRVWMDAGLNYWTGATQRNWGTCSAQILAVLGEGQLNGKPVQDVVHVMRRYEETELATIKAEFDTFLDRIRTTPTESHRGVVIAEIKASYPSRYVFVVRLSRRTRLSTFRNNWSTRHEVLSATHGR